LQDELSDHTMIHSLTSFSVSSSFILQSLVTGGYMAPEFVAIREAKRERRELPCAGYGLEADVYGGGSAAGPVPRGRRGGPAQPAQQEWRHSRAAVSSKRVRSPSCTSSAAPRWSRFKASHPTIARSRMKSSARSACTRSSNRCSRCNMQSAGLSIHEVAKTAPSSPLRDSKLFTSDLHRILAFLSTCRIDKSDRALPWKRENVESVKT